MHRIFEARFERGETQLILIANWQRQLHPYTAKFQEQGK